MRGGRNPMRRSVALVTLLVQLAVPGAPALASEC